MRASWTYLLVAVLAVGAIIACNKGGESPVTPTAPVPTGNTAPAASEVEEPVATTPVVETDPCHNDASCGKGLKAKFLSDQTLEVVSTNTGHDNSGVVCATDGFMGPNLAPGVTPYPWHVKAESTSTTPFPKDAIAEALEWEEGVCEQTVNVQLDAYRGTKCEGYILAVAWPQDTPITFTREGKWRELEPVITRGKWSECLRRESAELQAPDASFEADEVPNPEVCYKRRLITTLFQEENECEAGVREIRTTKVWKYRRCPCPGPVCEEFPTPEVTVTWDVLEALRVDGVQATGHTCDAQYTIPGGITPSVCAPPFDIQPPLPMLVPWGQTQEFVFSWAGTWTPVGTELECPISGQETDTVTAECKEWYPGSLPAEGRARLTFMSKLPDGRYLWRLQNNTESGQLTVRGPGYDQTFSIAPGTIGAFVTDGPYAGLSVYACNGDRLHGTASSNENVEAWCNYPLLQPGECPSGLCFYEVRGGAEGRTEEAVCTHNGGQWMRWGPHDKVQCVFQLPGILHPDFRLTPGQSDRSCLKHTGPR